jgi:hypothetical protein
VRPLLALLLFCVAVPVLAQSTPSLTLTVVDQTGAVIVAATVRLAPAGGAERTLATGDRGDVTFTGVAPGEARLSVESPGFLRHESAVTVRGTQTRREITMRIAGFEESLAVTDQRDQRGSATTTTLDADDLAGLPQDPDEFEAALSQLAGGDVVFRIDGFSGGRLPPREQIRQIRLRLNAFSAENHDSGHVIAEVITEPGTAWRGTINAGIRDEALNARNPFARTRLPDDFRRFTGTLSGPIVRGRTSLMATLDGTLSSDAQTIVAVVPGATVNDSVRRPSSRIEATAGIEQVFSRSQSLRLELQRRDERRSNLGVGDFALEERAYRRDAATNRLRATLQGVFGTSLLNQLRLEVRDESLSMRSAVDRPAIIVVDAFARGGAGMDADRDVLTFSLSDELDITAGDHSLRAGVLYERAGYDSRDQRNANGSFVFSSLDAFAAGRPNSYAQRLGDGRTAFAQQQLGFYVQDDARVTRNLSLSLGLRQEWQSNVGPRFNLMPRAAVTWNPFGWRTIVRAGYGRFTEWFSADLYDQALRVDGVTQRDLVVIAPGFPEPLTGAAAVVLPASVVQLATIETLPTIHQSGFSIQRDLTPAWQLQVSYFRQDGRNLPRSVNVNAENGSGVRPRPELGIVAQIEPTGRLAINRFTTGLTFRAPAGRGLLGVSYGISTAENSADSALALASSSQRPDADWGPAADDVRHRVFVLGNVTLPLGLRASATAQVQSGLPYTIVTGLDDNRDGVTNDRPDGVGRNDARGAWRADVGVKVSRQLGRRGELYAQGFNVLNRANFVGYGGNLQSPLFGRPVSASPARRVEFGLQVGF